jgi:hypothetical protein
LVIGAIVAVVVLLAVTLLGVLDLRGALPFSLHGPQAGLATPIATPTASPTATPAAPAGFTAYKDAGGLYILAYPSGWSKFDGASTGAPTPTVAGGGFGVAIFADGATGASFGVEYVQLSYPGGAQAFDDDIFKSFAQDGTVTNRTGPTTVSIAGESWTQESADVTASAGSQHLVVEAVSHNDYTVGIFYGAPKAIYAAVDSESFQMMISNFRFLK